MAVWLSASHRRFRLRAMCTCKQNEAERGKKGEGKDRRGLTGAGQGSQEDGKESTEWSAMQGWRKYATELVWTLKMSIRCH